MTDDYTHSTIEMRRYAVSLLCQTSSENVLNFSVKSGRRLKRADEGNAKLLTPLVAGGDLNSRPWGYESITTATEFHHRPHNPTKPERIAPNRVAKVAHVLYVLHEVWQKSGKELVPRSKVKSASPYDNGF